MSGPQLQQEGLGLDMLSAWLAAGRRIPRAPAGTKGEMCEHRSPGLRSSARLCLALGKASFIGPGVEMGQGGGNEKHPQPINLLLQLH